MLQLSELLLRLRERHGDPTLLAFEQGLAFDDEQRTVELTDAGVQPGDPDLAERPRERTHGSTLCSERERLLRRVMAQGQRDQAVVADDVEGQLQLLAPESTIANERALGWPVARLTLIEGIVEVSKILEAGAEHALIRSVARIRVVKQRDVAGLAHQQSEPHDAQVVALALRMPPLSEFSRRCRRDVRVEVRRVERQHIRRQFEVLHRSTRDLDLRGVDLRRGNTGCEPVERLATEGTCWKARDSRQRPIQKFRKVPLGPRNGGTLHGNREHYLADRRARLARASARAIDDANQIELFGDPCKRSHVADTFGSH